ncbi:hypothetical protein J2738_004197 [Variovorax paradoxus]|jgi:hypothetical protein|uniref:Uncharacterized protein n=1 Tax=Variovorax paradoxus TaxID=34073 RepID=A0AAE4BZJ5_VARPD|nr:hypothetical protein [Variovorax paradoxus]MDR6428042.1 hypothetical protein [Variovorax paradoxus]
MSSPFVFGLALAVLTAPAWSTTWSGTYVGGGPGVSFYVQLVESQGGTIVGRFKQVSVDKDNKLNTLDVPLSGAANGEQFVGRIEAGWANGDNIVVSGKRTPGGIQISGATGLRANLRAGTEEDEARALAALRQGAQQAIAAGELQKSREQQERNLKRRVESLHGILSGASSYVENGSFTYRNYAAYPKKYEATTAKLESTLDKLRATPGSGGEAGGRRTQLSSSMLHSKIDGTEHPHIEVRHAYEKSMRDWKDLDAKLSAATKACLEPTPVDLDVKAFQLACIRVPTVRGLVKTAGENSTTEFFKIRDVYKSELAKQEALLVEANRVSRSYDGR